MQGGYSGNCHLHGAIMSRRIALQFVVWFREKYREQAAVSGVYVAARNLRKQGVPLEYAVAILAGRRA